MFSRCGYQLSTDVIPNKIDTVNHAQLAIFLYSYDPFNLITRFIKNELYLNHISIFNNLCGTIYPDTDQSIPYLDIVSASENRIITSVFQDGTESEYQIVLQIEAKVLLPNKENYYPMNVQIHRTLINNPRGTLSNLVQENEILEEMYHDAAQKIVQQFLIQLINK